MALAGLLVGLAAASSSSSVARAQPVDVASSVPGRYVVELDPGAVAVGVNLDHPQLDDIVRDAAARAVEDRVDQAGGRVVVDSGEDDHIVVEVADPSTLENVVGVSGFEPELFVTPQLDVSLPLINAADQNLGGALGGTDADGSGTVVAVIDNGIDNDHPFFMIGGESRVVAEACFTFSSCQGGLSSDEGEGSAAHHGFDSHGTHVAGIAAGNSRGTAGSPARGVAGGASIAAVQVFEPEGGAYTSNIWKALEWLVELKQSGSNVVSVNLSLGGDPISTGNCDDQYPLSLSKFQALVDVGVTVIAAAGNDYDRSDISWPACMSNVIPVMSVNSDLSTSSFTNVNGDFQARGLAAPGSSIRSSVPGNGYANFSGTSMASPHVAGAVALLKQANPNLTVAEVKGALRNTLTLVDDTRTSGIATDVPLVDMCAAISAVRQESATVSATVSRSFNGVTTLATTSALNVMFSPVGVAEGRTTVSASISTDVAGGFVSPAIETGLWTLRVSDQYFSSETEPFCLSAGSELSLSETMTFSSGSLGGVVRLAATGMPIASSVVTVSATPVGELYGRIALEQAFTTSADGSFGPMVLGSGTWDISVVGDQFEVISRPGQVVAPGGTTNLDVQVSPSTRVEILYGLRAHGGVHEPPDPPRNGGWYGIGWQILNTPERYGFRYKTISVTSAATLADFASAPYTNSTANDWGDGSGGVGRFETNYGGLDFATDYRFQVEVVNASGTVVATSEVVEFTTLAEGDVVPEGTGNWDAFLGSNPYADGGLFSLPPVAPVIDNNQSNDGVSVSANSIALALTQSGTSRVSAWQYSTDNGTTWAQGVTHIVQLASGASRLQLVASSPSSVASQALQVQSSGFLPGTQYSVSVRAKNGEVVGTASSPVSVTMPGTPPAAPEPEVIESNPSPVVVSPPSGGGGGGGGGGGAPSPATQAVSAGSSGNARVQLGLAFGTVVLDFDGLSSSGSITATPKAGKPSFDAGGIVLPGYWLDITSSVSEFDAVEVCAPIETNNLATYGLSRDQLRLFHWENNVRKDVTTRLDLTNNRVCGEASSFSPFAVGALKTTRVAGLDRYETAAKLSASSFSPGVAVAYVVTGEKFPDALAAGAAAGREGGPVLLARSNSLPTFTVNELKRVAPRRVIVVGGTAVISDAVVASIRSTLPGIPVERVWGQDRFATAAQLSARTFAASGGTVYIGSGLGFTEILAGAAAAGRDKSPLLLVPGTGPNAGVPLDVTFELKRLNPRSIVVLGGSGLVSPVVVETLRELLPGASLTQFGGADAYDTAAKVARTFVGGGTIYVATGAVFADGLAGGAAAATRGHPMLMVPPSGSLPTPVVQALTQLRPSRVIVLGGTAAIARDIENAVVGYLP
ncbi:MAG: cell wall-binding repeat-containing protein [Actinomycetota bacterium]|nr:cell wall-binding repeat-containing protein [Actinomycetota bacterium]